MVKKEAEPKKEVKKEAVVVGAAKVKKEIKKPPKKAGKR